MNYFEQIIVPRNEAKHITELLEKEPTTEAECLGEDEGYTFGVRFSNGYEMDVEMCGVQYKEGECNKPWTQAILYDNFGREIAVSDVDDMFFGNWEIEHGGNTYTVYVGKRRKEA